MREPSMMVAMILAVVAMAGVVGDGAQAPALKRIPMQRGDLSVAGHEAVQAIAEFPPGVETGLHFHPGEEVSYVLEGALILEIEGEAPRTIKAGEVFMVPARKHHNGKNGVPGTTRVLATYIVEKGQPLATPVP